MAPTTEPDLTTIAFRDGYLSADTLISYDTFTNGNREKLAIHGPFIVAMAGFTWLRKPLEKWVADGCPEDAVPEDLLENGDRFEALILDADGNCFRYECGYLLPVAASYTAIGSGHQFAIGAMAHGATAEQAVAAAALHDKNTGGNIQSLHHSVLRS
jgi:hypothetical protein